MSKLRSKLVEEILEEFDYSRDKMAADICQWRIVSTLLTVLILITVAAMACLS